MLDAVADVRSGAVKSLVLASMEDLEPSPLAPLSGALWDQIAKSARGDFYPWQFERLLNSAADLLDRASQDRSTLISILAADLELRLQIESTDLRVAHDAVRYKLNGDAMADPVAYAALSAERSKVVVAEKDGIAGHFEEQIRYLNFVSTRGGLAPPTDTALQASAEMEATRASKAQFFMSTARSVRECDADLEELNRAIASVRLASAQHDTRKAQAVNGGILDFRHEAGIVARRMMRDFLEALARLSAAQAGLKDILGRGEVQLTIGNGVSALDAIPSAQDYVRQLILWHSKTTQFDQGFTVTVRLREYCDEAEWTAFLGGKTILFRVVREALGAWWLPRLRSICASYEGEQTRAVALRVKAPGVAIRSDGQRIIQGAVPPCFLGRVGNSRSPREPEPNGGVTMVNVCPIEADGDDWEATLQQFRPDHMPALADNLDDVVIELSCVGIPVSRAGVWAPEIEAVLEA